MTDCIFAFASLSEVQRLRHGLLEMGIFVDMIRTPRRLREKGCGFALKAPEDLANALRTLAKAYAITIRAEAAETAADFPRQTFADTDPG